jgi:HD superfamily phosphohydrolase YqeK
MEKLTDFFRERKRKKRLQILEEKILQTDLEINNFMLFHEHLHYQMVEQALKLSNKRRLRDYIA